MLRRFAVLPVALILVSAFAAGPVAAAAGGAAASHGPLGMVNPFARAGHGPPAKHTNNLIYNGGPVMQTNTVYAIFWGASDAWGPTSDNYIGTIDTYFKNVDHDSGLTSNVYASDTQYYDGSGSISYAVTYGGYYLDTYPYPKSGCRDKATPQHCLTDGQLQTEIQRVISQETSWPTGGQENLFFIFTPQGVGSCIGSSCAYTTYCAYHNWTGSSSNPLLYANMPYGAQSYHLFTCDSGQRPNNSTADATINLISHEHNEAITDEQGNAWYDKNGSENGDKCAWNFGSAQGPSGAEYNQTIGNNTYYLQQEWSNQSSGCVLSYSP